MLIYLVRIDAFRIFNNYILSVQNNYKSFINLFMSIASKVRHKLRKWKMGNSGNLVTSMGFAQI